MYIFYLIHCESPCFHCIFGFIYYHFLFSKYILGLVSDIYYLSLLLEPVTPDGPHLYSCKHPATTKGQWQWLKQMWKGLLFHDILISWEKCHFQVTLERQIDPIEISKHLFPGKAVCSPYTRISSRVYIAGSTSKRLYPHTLWAYHFFLHSKNIYHGTGRHGSRGDMEVTSWNSELSGGSSYRTHNYSYSMRQIQQ